MVNVSPFDIVWSSPESPATIKSFINLPSISTVYVPPELVVNVITPLAVLKEAETVASATTYPVPS